MTRKIVVEDIISDSETDCQMCQESESDQWIKSEEGAIYCTDCIFGFYDVEYKKYVDYILKSRRKSLDLAMGSQSPEELIGQCHRNAACTLDVMVNQSSLPREHVFLCVGEYKDERLDSHIKHYWVGIGSEPNLVYVDPVVPVNNSGILVSNQLPASYKLNSRIPYSQSYSFPSEVKKWMN